MTMKKPDVPGLKHWFHTQMPKYPLRRINYIVSLTFEILLSNKQAWKKWSRLKIYWTTVFSIHYLSSLRRRSSRSWILFSSWETPAEERLWPSMSATRPLNSFSCRTVMDKQQFNKYPEYTMCVCVLVCVHACARTYMSLHGVLVQLQVLFGGSLLHELRAELIDLVSAPGHSVCHHLRTASLLLQLQLQTLQLILTETRWNSQ